MKKKLIIMGIFILFMFAGSSCTKTVEEIKPIKIEDEGVDLDFDKYLDSSGAKVIFLYDDNGVLYKFIAYGNTNYKEYGEDIIAAALSTLSINTINSLLELTDIDVKYLSKEVNGKPFLECYIEEFQNAKQKEDFDLLVESFRLGAEGIEDSYGSQYLEVIKVD